MSNSVDTDATSLAFEAPPSGTTEHDTYEVDDEADVEADEDIVAATDEAATATDDNVPEAVPEAMGGAPGAAGSEEITELDEPVLPIEVRIIQSVEERMNEMPFFNAYNDQDLLSLIHNLLAKSKVDERIIHGKALGYFQMIKEYHRKRQQPFKLPEHVLLHVHGERPDYSDTVAVVASMNPKKTFIAKQKDLNAQYMPIPQRIGIRQPWIPKQGADVALSEDGTQRVRVLARDQVELDVIGYFKQGLAAYKALDFAPPFAEKFEAYMTAVDQQFDVNGFIKELNELTDLETLEKMLYEYDGVHIDDLTAVQQKVILFRLMRLADLEKPQVLESSSSAAFKPQKRLKEVQHPMHASAEAAQQALKSLVPSWEEIQAAAEAFERILSDARRTYERPESKWFASPKALFEAIRDKQLTLDDAIRQMKAILFKKDIEADFAFVKELVRTMKNGSGAENTEVSAAASATAFGDQLRKSLRDERDPILRRYETKLHSAKGTRTYFLEEALAGRAVAEEQNRSGMENQDMDLDNDMDANDFEIADGAASVLQDEDKNVFEIDAAGLDASIREHVPYLAHCFAALRDASQLPLDLASLVDVYKQHLKGTSRLATVRAAFGDYLSDTEILRVLAGGEITNEDIREPLEALLKSVRATYKKEVLQGFYLGMTWWILQLQQQFAAGQLTSLDPLSPGCKPMWALTGPPMSDFSAKRGALVFIMCAARFLWPAADAFGRMHLADALNQSDDAIAKMVSKTASEVFPEPTAYVRDAWKTRLQEEEKAKKAPLNPYIVQLAKMKDPSSEHIRAYNKALLYLPSILLSTFKDPAKLLLPLRNTCCVQELTTTFKAYSDIRAINSDIAKNHLWLRHVYFGKHFRAPVDARRGLVVVGAQAASAAPTESPDTPELARAQTRFGARRKAAAAELNQFEDEAPPTSILKEYQDVLASVRIPLARLGATRNDLMALIRNMITKKDDEHVQRLQANFTNLDEPLALELLHALGRNLQKHTQKAPERIVSDIRDAQATLGSLRAAIKARLLRRKTAVEMENQINLRDVLSVLICHAMLLPTTPVSNKLTFIKDGTDAFTMWAAELRTIIADGVREVGSCLGDRTLPSQEDIFNYITQMRESQKQEKIDKYEKMTAREKEDARLLKRIGFNPLALLETRVDNEDSEDDEEDIFDEILAENAIGTFYNAEEKYENGDIDTLDD